MAPVGAADPARLTVVGVAVTMAGTAARRLAVTRSRFRAARGVPRPDRLPGYGSSPGRPDEYVLAPIYGLTRSSRSRWWAVAAGDVVVVTDVEGRQVGDLWAVDAADHGRWLSTGHTRDVLERLFPRVGESFVDQRYEPILQLRADTSPGAHDMLFPACNPALYERAGLPGHPSCAENFAAAAGAAGVRLLTLPDPVDLFQNSAPG